jgi:hypothetical protein
MEIVLTPMAARCHSRQKPPTCFRGPGTAAPSQRSESALSAQPRAWRLLSELSSSFVRLCREAIKFFKSEHHYQLILLNLHRSIFPGRFPYHRHSDNIRYKTTKHFRKAEKPQYIEFGSTRDNDEACNLNIHFGQLELVSDFSNESLHCSSC